MWLLRYAIGLCLLTVTLSAGQASADENRDVAIWQGKWNELDLQVIVIAANHTIPDIVKRKEPWWRWGNTRTDSYLFSFGEKDRVDLILGFDTEGGKTKATFYILDESQARNLQVRDTRLILPPETHPRLILWPRNGDWLSNGKANFDLEVQEFNPKDGALLWKTSVGAERPGVPKWVTRQLAQDLNPEQGYSRFEAAVRENPAVPYELVTPLLPSWPYLSVGRPESHWGKNQPFFYDPVEHKISLPWVGFQIAGIYSINSICYPPRICFEAPFAWYRFDPNAGRYANLVIRSDLWPKGTKFGPPDAEFQRSALRMTWTEKVHDLWRYSLTVAGNHVMDEQVAIGNTKVQAVPYQKLPSWVATKPWKAVTFVEATQGEPGSEGIYDYSVEDNFPVTSWINGLRTDSPGTFRAPPLDERSEKTDAKEPSANFREPFLQYPTIHPNRLSEGFRGEYSLVYNRVPQLYLSPVDNRLHLLYAEGGIWNLGNGKVLRMHNLNNGAYVDGWTRERVSLTTAEIGPNVMLATPGEVEEALYALDGYLLYTGFNGVELRETTYRPTIREFGPPTDRASWRLFPDQIAPITDQQRDPGNFRSWLSYFPGESLKLSGGHVSGVRKTARGFRFVVELQSGFRLQGRDLLGIAGLKPGTYVVEYDGEFDVERLTPPSPTASVGNIILRQLEPGNVPVILENDGLEDIESATLELWANPENGEPALVADQAISLLGQERTVVKLRWAPSRAGRWTLKPQLRLAPNHVVTFKPISITVSPPDLPIPGALISASTTPRTIPFVVVGLAVFAGLAGLSFWKQWNPWEKAQVDDAISS